MYNPTLFTTLGLPADWISGWQALLFVGLPLATGLWIWVYYVAAQHLESSFRMTIAAASGVLGLIFVALHIHYFPLCTDDTFISLRYAEKLAHGEGFCFNSGQRVEGFSNPLWVILMAGLVKLGATQTGADYLLPLAAKLSGIVLHGVLFVLFFGWAMRRKESAGLLSAGLVGAVWIVAAGTTTLWAVSGMETALHGLILFLIAFTWSGTEGRMGSPRHPKCFSALLLILTLSRPEGAMLALAAAGFWLVSSKRIANRTSRAAWLALLSVLAILAVETAFRLIYFGDWLPNTFAAKVSSSILFQARRGVLYLGFAMLATGGWLWIAVAVRAVRQSARWTNPAAVIIVAQMLFIVLVGGDWMPGFRFWAPVLPLAAMLLVQLLREEWAQSLLQKILATSRTRTVAFCAAAVLLLLSIAGFDRIVIHQYDFTVTGFRGMALAPLSGHYDIAVKLRETIPDGATIAGGEAGLIPYVTGAPFIDCLGLVDRDIANSPRHRREISDAAAILEKKPDYIVLGPVGQNMLGEWAVPGEYVNTIRAHPDFAAQYNELMRNSQFVVYNRFE